MKCIVSYDITSNKRRRHVDRALLGYGSRVQKSVFEALLSNKEYERMVERLSGLIDEDTDSVRVYVLCESCKTRLKILGQGIEVEKLGYVII